MSYGKAFLVALTLLGAPACTSDPEPATDEEAGETEGEHHPLTANYRLVRLDYNPLKANESVLIVAPRAGPGEKREIRVGETLDDWKVVRMAMQIDGISAVVTVLEDEQEVQVPINP